MPKAHVLHAFRDRRALYIFHRPPDSSPLRNVYRTACQPPPDFNRFMWVSCFAIKKGKEVSTNRLGNRADPFVPNARSECHNKQHRIEGCSIESTRKPLGTVPTNWAVWIGSISGSIAALDSRSANWHRGEGSEGRVTRSRVGALPPDYTSSSSISSSDREIRELSRGRAFKPIQSVDVSRPDDPQSRQKRVDGIRIPFQDDANTTIDRVFHISRHWVIAGQFMNRKPHPNPLDSTG